MNFESISPFDDKQVNEKLNSLIDHPMMLAVLDYAFPDQDRNFYKKVVDQCHSIQDFQGKIIYPALQRVIKESSAGITTSGFDQLDKNSSYLFISNHRDIVLDTSLTNVIMYEKKMVMTASAIGDNLVQNPFLLDFSRLNRNFLVKRSLGPREMLTSSINLAKYITYLIEQGRSVWLAQREGRTKDGNDQTQAGVLKMLTLGKPKDMDMVDHLKSLKIVPLCISYEFDPTDYLKMPALLANYYDQEYVKTKNEDFNNIMTGVLGKKGRIHISAGEPIREAIDHISKNTKSTNQLLKEFSKHVTEEIHKMYNLWPSNYIAYDLLYKSNDYADFYTENEREYFLARVEKKTTPDDNIMRQKFLAMYAYPVLNKQSSTF